MSAHTAEVIHSTKFHEHQYKTQAGFLSISKSPAWTGTLYVLPDQPILCEKYCWIQERAASDESIFQIPPHNNPQIKGRWRKARSRSSGALKYSTDITKSVMLLLLWLESHLAGCLVIPPPYCLIKTVNSLAKSCLGYTWRFGEGSGEGRVWRRERSSDMMPNSLWSCLFFLGNQSL